MSSVFILILPLRHAFLRLSTILPLLRQNIVKSFLSIPHRSKYNLKLSSIKPLLLRLHLATALYFCHPFGDDDIVTRERTFVNHLATNF